jgi:hypothetical protein
LQSQLTDEAEIAQAERQKAVVDYQDIHQEAKRQMLDANRTIEKSLDELRHEARELHDLEVAEEALLEFAEALGIVPSSAPRLDGDPHT